MSMIYSFLLAVLFSSCGFSSQEKNAGYAPASLSSSLDSDGDMVSDIKEKENGTNPIIANIPELEIDFMSDYKIVVKYIPDDETREKEFVIDTREQEDASIAWSSETFLKRKSLAQAARVAQYDSHIWGEVDEHDFSWVSASEVPPKTLSENILRYRHFFDEERFGITGISISFENSVKLLENRGFSHIKNLKLNFRYFDYERGKYIIATSVTLDHQINQGVRESFTVEIEDAAIPLIRDNYLMRGEFLILEVVDFEIPELETTYQILMGRVRNKSMPVVLNTPTESKVQYVGIKEDKNRFQHILETLFEQDYLIEQEELKKIGQFESNLPSYTYLHNIVREDKKGKWFVFTDEISGHYLNHLYTPEDTLALTYATGSELAAQTASREIRYHYAQSDDLNHYSLGNVSAHSNVHIQLKPGWRWGTVKRHRKYDSFLNSEYRCHIDIYTFEEFRAYLGFATDTHGLSNAMDDGNISKGALLSDGNALMEDFSNVKLVIGNEEFSFRQLMDEDKVFFEETEDGHIHFSFYELSRIVDIEEGEERPISIKLQEIEETASNGIRLSSMDGKFWFLCPDKATDLARSYGMPLSEDSAGENLWMISVRSGRVTRGEKQTYRQYFSLESSSTIVNHHN